MSRSPCARCELVKVTTIQWLPSICLYSITEKPKLTLTERKCRITSVVVITCTEYRACLSYLCYMGEWWAGGAFKIGCELW